MWIKTIITIIILATALNVSFASYNFASKGRVTGPSIHTTYFLTPNNASFDVNAKAYMGRFVNGTCVYSDIYNMGQEFLSTGDFIDFDAFKLKSIVGMNYNCMSVYYTYTQLVIETFILFNNGINYTNTIPAYSEVTIL